MKVATPGTVILLAAATFAAGCTAAPQRKPADHRPAPDGLLIRPVIPADVCGRLQPQVLDALQHVPWVTVHASAHAKRMPGPARHTDAQTVRKPGYHTKLAQATCLTRDLRRRIGRGVLATARSSFAQ
jgi:hypothetical protein